MIRGLAQACGTTLGLWLSFGQTVHAQELPIELNYSAPVGCGSAEAVLEEVRSMLGLGPTRDTRETIRLDAQLHKAGEGRLELTLRAPSDDSVAERRLEVANCADAVHATALLLAFMVNPNAQLTQAGSQSVTSAAIPSRAPSLEPKPPSLGAPNPRAPEARHLPTSGQETHSFFVGVSGQLDQGNLPRTALGLSLRVGLNLPRLRLELRASDSFTVEHASQQEPATGGRFKLYDAAVLGCYRAFYSGRHDVYACAGPSGLYLRGTGYGLEEVSTKNSLYVSLLGELAYVVRLSGRYSVVLAGGGLLALVRPQFAIQNEGLIHEPARISGRLALGFECGF